MSSMPQRTTSYWLLAAFFAAFVLFMYGPMLVIVVLSFQGPEGGLTFPLRGLSLHWFGKLAEGLRAKLEPFATTFLLPMFFTFSGLNTQMQVLGNLDLIGATLAILAAAIIAKGGACYIAARLSGEDHKTSLGIGALMNARGLMELIIINIGLQQGVIGPALFAILVLMAIVTTLMAAPLFALTQR